MVKIFISMEIIGKKKIAKLPKKIFGGKYLKQYRKDNLIKI